ncbi:MAG: septum formation initiator family protein [Chitinivibrionales bacterium]
MKIKKIGRWVVVAVVALVLSFLFTGNNSIINLYSSHLDIKKKEREIQKKRKEMDSLTTEIKKLKTDTLYMERIAREKLGMAGKNEKVYKFIEGK